METEKEDEYRIIRYEEGTAELISVYDVSFQ